jgi:acetolactate synthase-1/2/3 large subunit
MHESPCMLHASTGRAGRLLLSGHHLCKPSSTNPPPLPCTAGYKEWKDRFGNEARKGSDILVQALEREGVTQVFAYPGGASMEIHQALTRSDSITNYLCRHEQVSWLIQGHARTHTHTHTNIHVCMRASCLTSFLSLHARVQGEIFAAEGYAKSSGAVGVCIATSGPGATNLVTGLADAMLDSVPLVAITGQVGDEG